jgi:DNA-binding response OmpR family regulator
MVREALAHHRIDADLICHKDGEQMLRYIAEIDAGRAPCPDVILLDLNLPRHNGETLLARMRESPLCSEVPVVIVTSSTAAKDRDTVLRLGATRYFHKPSDYDEFMRLGAVVLEVAPAKGIV